MRICLVSTVFPPAIGGPSLQTYQLALALEHAGNETTVVTLRHPERRPDLFESMQGVRLIEAGTVKNSSAGKIGWKLALAGAVYRELHLHRYDVLHCQNGPGLAGLFVGQIARVCRVPSVAKFPGDEVIMRVNSRKRLCMDRERVYNLTWQTRFWRAVQVSALRSYTLVWAPSTYQRDNLVNLFEFPTNRVLLFPNYVNINLLHRLDIKDANRKPIVVCACRIIALKGVDLLLQAYSQVPQEVRGEFWLIGDGIPEVVAEIRQLIARLKLSDCVHFIGRIQPAEIPGYLGRADIFFHTLLHRWAGIVFFEAFAAGLCVVAHNLGSWPEQADFEEIPALVGRDQASTTRLLEQALRDPSLRHACAQRGQAYVAQFDLRANLDNFLAAYDQAIYFAEQRA